ncbi:hypothetical protein M3Y94_00680700 [Aphelenchoides besseyi]|nr:hypothetical protein M3Y94_00680700 [Aphelenchoides besseyi]
MDDSDVDYELVESKYPKVDKSTQTYKKLTSEGFWQNGFLVFTYKTVLQVAIAWLTLAMVGIILWHGNRLSHERLVCKHLQMLMEQNSTVFNKIAQLEEALAQSEERMSKWVEQQNPQLQTSESMKQAMETDGNVCKQKVGDRTNESKGSDQRNGNDHRRCDQTSR